MVRVNYMHDYYNAAIPDVTPADAMIGRCLEHPEEITTRG